MCTQGSSQHELKKLVVGNRGQILIVSFDGANFTITGKYVNQNWMPSWMIFKDPNLLYAVNAIGDETSVFKLQPDFSTYSNLIRPKFDVIHGSLTKLFYDKPTFVSSFGGSIGGVHLVFNADKTRLVQPCYRSGEIIVWDSSAADGSLKFMKTLTILGTLTPGWNHHRPHQAVLDPTGRFFVVPNLSADTLQIIDTKDDLYEITGLVVVRMGFEPRRVAFLINGGATFMVSLGELSNELSLQEIKYEYEYCTLRATAVGHYSTYNKLHFERPVDAAASELEIARNQEDIYISNRYTDDETDHIAHFKFKQDMGLARLEYVGKTSTSGLQPRSFSLSTDDEQRFVFVGNEIGESGLVALKRDPSTGILDPTPVATISNEELAAAGSTAGMNNGPQFVCEI
ncbi:putative isomerase YbhE [Annulohypoxylon bovei var. microspora]|nr:putative isomerase YbhE [Annulohypoxylon bovei var. microspora]